jgi:hypothetical protein
MESSGLTVQEASSEAWQKGGESVLKGSCIIQQTIELALKEKRGALIGRHGTIELSVVLSTMFKGTPDMNRSSILERNAGIFPAEPTFIEDWVSDYKDAAEEADVMAVSWFKPLAALEWNYIQKINPLAKKIPLRSLEPYYTASPWISCLAGKRVAVVSSFAETMKSQANHFDKIWPETLSTSLCQVEWTFVRSYYSPVLAQGHCEWPEPIQSWQDAVEYLEKQVLESGVEIALLGCGGLAMPLAARLMKKGVIVVVMGGAIQVLFGIRGRRWEQHLVISGFYNEAWVYPVQEEVPRGAEQVEGGCYW